jgi:hypothetical protein
MRPRGSPLEGIRRADSNFDHAGMRIFDGDDGRRVSGTCS